ncbi:S8 family serine peptidase [uncultured Paludibaculum sp.]|uniref:S8 family serine peptidase n=1 Tax=uncultured Paludibaculum sp. TaxID=1765020 RepID=UPI002AAB59B9|nr:S8 family serine peptidase [uncultured Paludibaculum sp.]
MKRNPILLTVWLVLAPGLFAETLPGRYIVELTSQPVSEYMTATRGRRANLRGAEAEAHRSRLRSEQGSMRANIEKRRGVVLESVNTVANALFVQADEQTAKDLARMPGVRRVVPVRMMHRVLDRAVLLHKVSDVWSQFGESNAGAGMKIGIIDTGIEISHPAFQNSSLTVPDTYPRANSFSDLNYTNNKVIVARSYVDLLPYRDIDYSPSDHIGHGTALATIAAGGRNEGPLATIQGVAPMAYLGVYKVFGTPGYNDYASDDAIIKAFDDAVADGMDVISLSVGDDFAPRIEDDPDVAAVQRATEAGVIVVIAAGNNGPGMNTVGSPATAPSAITVGATTNDRTFASNVEISGLSSYVAYNGYEPAGSVPVTGTVVDTSTLNGNSLGCTAFQSGSLSGKIALIQRGDCNFEDKINNARNAGAVGVLVYMRDTAPDPIYMSVGAATLPSQAISYGDGSTIKQALTTQSDLSATMHFEVGSVPVTANRLTDFSAAGPSVDGGIKPEIVAVGENFYTGTQTIDYYGDMYDSSGYVLVNGTSFSTPFVAGTAALIKSLHPGLTVDQYRSMIINNGATASNLTGDPASIQQAGGGLVDASAAVNTTVTAYPATLALGAGGTDAQVAKTLTITNIGAGHDTFTIAAETANEQMRPVVDNATVELDSGASTDLGVTWTGSGLTNGAYQGFVTITSTSTGKTTRVPYWFASTSSAPAGVTMMYNVGTAPRRGRTTVYFRVLDAAGLVLSGADPTVTSVSGGGTALGVANYDSNWPGVYAVSVRLGFTAGANVFRITAGDLTYDFTVTGY